MVGSVLLAVATLRAGLAIRRRRQDGARPQAALRRRHLRLAKPAVVALLLGFALGPASAVWLRGWDGFSTLHGVFGALAALLFAATGVLGRRLERGRLSAREAHGLLGLLAVLVAAVAATTGLVLLP